MPAKAVFNAMGVAMWCLLLLFTSAQKAVGVDKLNQLGC
jgi:hypothetical protein